AAQTIYQELGLTPEATWVGEQIVRAERALKDQRRNAALARGDAARAAQQWQEAKAAYEESLALTRELGDRAQEVKLVHNLGLLVMDQEDWDGARSYHQQALQMYQALGLTDAAG